ncbi:MAG: ABC transporter ATP-binding protein [Planctomycetaceae bacterium]|nr:ABC transporter ATP-binding protein [Planctomycetaceae bacterium]
MLITVKKLVKRYGGKVVLDHVDLEFAPGEAVAIVGVNGAGKTTLLECLSQIQLPSSGEVLIQGELLKRDRIDLRRQFAFLPGIPESDFGSPLAYIGTIAAAYGVDTLPEMPNRVVDLLQHFEVHEFVRNRWSHLSRGQQYKMMLVAMIATDPPIWLLDEPFSAGMDPLGIRQLRQQIRQAVEQRSRNVIFTTQILEVAARTADRICVMHQGKIVANKPTVELLEGNSLDNLDANFERLIRDVK